MYPEQNKENQDWDLVYKIMSCVWPLSWLWQDTPHLCCILLCWRKEGDHLFWCSHTACFVCSIVCGHSWMGHTLVTESGISLLTRFDRKCEWNDLNPKDMGEAPGDKKVLSKEEESAYHNRIDIHYCQILLSDSCPLSLVSKLEALPHCLPQNISMLLKWIPWDPDDPWVAFRKVFVGAPEASTRNNHFMIMI